MVKFDPNTRHLILMYVAPDGFTKVERTIDLTGIDEDTVQFVIQIAKTVVNFANFNLDTSRLKQKQETSNEAVIQPVVISTIDRLHQKLVNRRNLALQTKTIAVALIEETALEQASNIVKRAPNVEP